MRGQTPSHREDSRGPCRAGTNQPRRPLGAGAMRPTTTPAMPDSGFLTALFSQFVNWFASAVNSIGDFFANVGHFNETDTQKLCTKKSGGTQVCASATNSPQC